jgi:crotonobetaine/carnitine-CoA ligase
MHPATQASASSPGHGFPTREEAVISALLVDRAARHPDKVFLAYEDGSEWTYRETLEESWRAAAALAGMGVGRGDTVSVLLPAGAALMRVWLGAATIGAVFAPLNLAARGRFLEHTLNVAGAAVLVVHAGLADRLVGLQLPALQTVVVVGQVDGIELLWPVRSLDDVMAGARTEAPAVGEPVQPWDDAVLIYTSGTTGPSKGVLCSYAALWMFNRNFVWPDVGEDDRFLQALPMFHMAGVGCTYAMLVRAGSVALLPAFDAKRFWQDVTRFGATTSAILHAMVSFLLSAPPGPEDADNPLRVAYMGPLSQVEEFSRRFGVDVYTAFGMTEVPVPIRSGLNPTNERSCGTAVDPTAFELVIADEHGIPVPAGQPGELLVRHRLPWVMNSGYRGMPEATSKAWAHGWFHTGDQFIEDSDGSFYFVDRVKDAIRRRGENISSFEVEQDALAHPEVEEVAAVAVPNPDVAAGTGDEEVKVVVVRSKGSNLTPEALTQYLIERVPRHWVPRFIEFASELPRTPSFKVKKAELRAAGITATTWDRERAGVVLKRDRLAL